jgi:N-6 DNA Methylase
VLDRSRATVTLSQIAELAGVGASAVSNWRKRFDDFPLPTETAAGGRDLYSLADVEAWLRVHSRLDPERVNERLLFEAADLVRGQAPADEVVTILATAIALAHAVDELSLDPGDRTAHSLVKDVELCGPGLARIFTPIEDLDPRLADEIFDLASMIAPSERLKVFEQVLGRRGRFVETRTSSELVSLVVRLAGDGEAILDPAAGEGGLLAASAESSSASRRLYGQEINEAAWRTARQRFLLRSIDVDLQLGDSLLDDAFPHLLVDVVVCDPPYGTKNDRESLELCLQPAPNR